MFLSAFYIFPPTFPWDKARVYAAYSPLQMCYGRVKQTYIRSFIPHQRAANWGVAALYQAGSKPGTRAVMGTTLRDWRVHPDLQLYAHWLYLQHPDSNPTQPAVGAGGS